MKAVIFSLLLAPPLIYAQEAPSGAGLDGTRALPRNVDLSQFSGPLSANIQLERQIQFHQFLPQDLTDEKKAKALSLMRELNDVCPACSTGASPTGPVIRGANGVAGTGPLFGDRHIQGYVYVKQSEYDELKIKAAAYDLLKK